MKTLFVLFLITLFNFISPISLTNKALKTKSQTILQSKSQVTTDEPPLNQFMSVQIKDNSKNIYLEMDTTACLKETLSNDNPFSVCGFVFPHFTQERRSNFKLVQSQNPLYYCLKHFRDDVFLGFTVIDCFDDICGRTVGIKLNQSTDCIDNEDITKGPIFYTRLSIIKDENAFVIKLLLPSNNNGTPTFQRDTSKSLFLHLNRADYPTSAASMNNNLHLRQLSSTISLNAHTHFIFNECVYKIGTDCYVEYQPSSALVQGNKILIQTTQLYNSSKDQGVQKMNYFDFLKVGPSMGQAGNFVILSADILETPRRLPKEDNVISISKVEGETVSAVWQSTQQKVIWNTLNTYNPECYNKLDKAIINCDSHSMCSIKSACDHDENHNLYIKSSSYTLEGDAGDPGIKFKIYVIKPSQ